jgi:hypothetical protein
MSVRGQPDQRPAPVGRIALALQQALALQVRHDLADDRLGPVQVGRGLAHGQRAGQGQVLEHGPRRSRQLPPRSVAAMKRQVDGPEELREPFGLGLILPHATRVAASRSIVNPDGSRAASAG